VGDGRYDWRLLDANMAVARRYGLKFLIKVADRSFDGSNIMPGYFPSQYVLWTYGNGNAGYVSKRWDPYVYNRMIRLYRAIANRYAAETAFGGIATTETAVGSVPGSDYSLDAYRTALVQIATQTQSSMPRGKLFLYLNFLKGGDDVDMNKDARVDLLERIPHTVLVVGAPDITPDVAGMPGNTSSYRIHARKNLSLLPQFCHLQHVDQGLGGRNVKSNLYRQEFFDGVAAIRDREAKPWFNGTPAVFEFDDLRDPNGHRVNLHPSWVVGNLWQPNELFRFGRRNFDCDYVIWHYRDYPRWNEFGWDDVRPVILNNQYFYH
jgi:hypothetical protein